MKINESLLADLGFKYKPLFAPKLFSEAKFCRCRKFLAAFERKRLHFKIIPFKSVGFRISGSPLKNSF